MENIWKHLSQKLHLIYKQENILDYYENDEQYLKYAFIKIEELWEIQFNKIDKLKIIMISEAPLFGKDEKYIYNIDTPPSSFFYFNDLEAFSTVDALKKVQKPIQKQKMFKEFQKNGFIILDLFPFALNQEDTQINYRNMSKKLYKQLLDVSLETYLIPKLKKCLKKTESNVYFLYRYKRLFEKTEYVFEKMLKKLEVNNYTIDTINGTNMSLDRKKLFELLRS